MLASYTPIDSLERTETVKELVGIIVDHHPSYTPIDSLERTETSKMAIGGLSALTLHSH